jgi:hypothetical protein
MSTIPMFIPETRDTERTWKNICVRASDIIRNKDAVTPSQLSQFMGDIHKVFVVHNFVDEDEKEKELIKRMTVILKLFSPIHYKICNGEKASPVSWKKLELFLSANSFLS